MLVVMRKKCSTIVAEMVFNRMFLYVKHQYKQEMKKIYSSPKVDCTSVNSRELMQSVSVSIGDGDNQNLFYSPQQRK